MKRLHTLDRRCQQGLGGPRRKTPGKKIIAVAELPVDRPILVDVGLGDEMGRRRSTLSRSCWEAGTLQIEDRLLEFGDAILQIGPPLGQITQVRRLHVKLLLKASLGGDHGDALLDGGAVLAIEVLLETRIHGHEHPLPIGGALTRFQDEIGKNLVGNWIGMALIPDDRVSLDYTQCFV
jgi:hypothetical protein